MHCALSHHPTPKKPWLPFAKDKYVGIVDKNRATVILLLRYYQKHDEIKKMYNSIGHLFLSFFRVCKSKIVK